MFSVTQQITQAMGAPRPVIHVGQAEHEGKTLFFKDKLDRRIDFLWNVLLSFILLIKFWVFSIWRVALFQYNISNSSTTVTFQVLQALGSFFYGHIQENIGNYIQIQKPM